MVHRLSVVGGLVVGLVGGLVVGLVAGLILGVVGLALVPDIGDVAGVAVVDLVGDDLGPAVGEGDAVLAVGGVPVPVLVLAEVGARVAVLNAVLEAVRGGLIVGGLVVGRLGLVVGRLGLVVGGRGGVVGGLVVLMGSVVAEGNGREGSESDEDLKMR